MGTVALSIHGWRRPCLSHDLFMLFLTLGFLTLGVSRLVIADQLRELRAHLRRLRGDVDSIPTKQPR